MTKPVNQKQKESLSSKKHPVSGLVSSEQQPESGDLKQELNKAKYNLTTFEVEQIVKFIQTHFIEKEKAYAEAVKQVRYGNLGRCPRHDEALKCLECVKELFMAKQP